jgi:hypothetical protein
VTDNLEGVLRETENTDFKVRLSYSLGIITAVGKCLENYEVLTEKKLIVK